MAINSSSPIIAEEYLKKADLGHKLNGYLDLLESENRKINLVSRETSRADYARLAAESILPVDRISSGPIQSYLDIGSGGGFPAIPLLLTQPISQATLIEKIQKKAGALNRIGVALNLPIKVLPIALEQFETNDRFDLITIRLVRLTPKMLDQLLPLLTPEGELIYYNKIDSDLAEYSHLASHHEFLLSNRPSPLAITSFKKN